MACCDVVILGGGPAGCATALSLRSHCPSLKLVLLEASAYAQPRVGEVLPAIARPLLTHLGVWESFTAESFRSVHSQAAAWGQPALIENHFIYSARGAGWHLDRTRFDQLLAEQVAQRGVEVRFRTRVVSMVQAMADLSHGADGTDIAPEADAAPYHWHFHLSDRTLLQAKFVVDATGRRALIAQKMGARPQLADRLTAFVRFFSLNSRPIAGTAIEAFPHGWWYTALAGKRRVVACLSDHDIACELGLKESDRWLSLLQQTQWIRSRVGDGVMQGDAIVRPASATCLDRLHGNHWLAVGDAASAYDPLSSQGITKALRLGIFAGYAVGDRLTQANGTGLAKYASLVRREYASYRTAHRQYSLQEQRWPQNRFWARRHCLHAQ